MYQLHEKIIDHHTKGQAISTENLYIHTPSVKNLRKTTIGWEMCCRWRDGETSWVKLKDIKELYPLDVADYAVANKIL